MHMYKVITAMLNFTYAESLMNYICVLLKNVYVPLKLAICNLTLYGWISIDV